MIDTILNNHSKIDVFCIGTPAVAGDVIGPLVGSMLQQHDFDKDVKVIGTIGAPVTNSTYEYYRTLIREDSLVIVVDSTVGTRVGTHEIVFEPTSPGAALKSGIEPIGDISVKAYTGRSVAEMLQAKHWKMATMAHVITTELVDLLSNNKKGIYIDIKI